MLGQLRSVLAPVVRVEDVSKRFLLHHDRSLKERVLHRTRSSVVEDFWALRRVTLHVEPAHTVGLIGANGSGKTTLLKVIGGILSPTSGTVARRGRVAALLELGAGFHPDLTGRENVYLNASILGLRRRQTDLHFDAIVDFAGIGRFIDNQVKFYSSGMYLRLAFAVAVHVDPEILLVDEVLAVGDEPFQRQCLARIRDFQAEGRTIVFVTHGLDTVRELCDRAILLDRGEVVVDGKPHEAIRAFREGPIADLPVQPKVSGSGEIVVASAVTTDESGRARTAFYAGGSLAVQIRVEASQPVDDVVVGIQILNHLGMLMFGTDTSHLQLSFERAGAARLITFRFPSLALAEATYSLNIGVASSDRRRIYQFKERCLSFRVRTTAPGPGMLHLDPRVEVIPK